MTRLRDTFRNRTASDLHCNSRVDGDDGRPAAALRSTCINSLATTDHDSSALVLFQLWKKTI